ncbi:PD-(D/E)XK nuclease-like domain-containing protein [Nocardia xishanensis]
MTAPTEPGLFAGVPESVYHGDRNSISSSQMRRFLEVTPHRWRAELDRPRKPTEEQQWGSAVHTLVLGVGAPPVDTGYDLWNTNKAKERVAEIRKAGGIPLRPKAYDGAHQAAANLRANSDVAAVLASGQPELSVWSRDPYTDVMMRARLDWAQWLGPNRVRVGDVKTTTKPGPREWVWSAADFGYHIQEPWYADVLANLAEPVEVVEWLWLVVCSDPPYEAWVSELPAPAVDLGRRTYRRGLDLFAHCRDTDSWPSHESGIHLLDLPYKTYRQEEWIS